MRRAFALIILMTLLMGIELPAAKEQRGDSLATLDQRTAELIRARKYAEAAEVATRALALAERQFGPEQPNVAMWLNLLGFLYQSQDRYADAEPLYKRSLAIREKALGPDHPDVASVAYDLAGLYHAQRRYADAEPLYKRALAVREKTLGHDHPDVGLVLNNLAQLYVDERRPADAEPVYKRTLATFEKAFGPDSPQVATVMNNLAFMYQAYGRYAEAEELFKRALAVREKALGPDHPDVALSLNNLANVYDNQGRGAEAEPLYKRALAINEKTLGPNHPKVALALNNLAELYRVQARGAEAEPLYKRSIAIFEKASGPDDLNLATVLNNLALLYHYQNRISDAVALQKRSLAIRERALGPDHPDVANSLVNLAELYREQGNYAEAEPLYKRGLAMNEKAFGPDHPAVAATLNNLAALYDDLGRYAEAETLYKRSLAIHEKLVGPDHPHVATALSNLAFAYSAQGRYSEAEPLLKRSLAIKEKALGPDHPDVAITLNNLGSLYHELGRYPEVESLFKRTLTIYEHAVGPDHPSVGGALDNLASLYREQGRYAEAEPLLKRSLAIREKAFGPEHPDVATVLSNLGALYDDEGRHTEAEAVYQRSLVIREKALGPSHPDVALSLNNLALAYQRQGRRAEAEPLYKRALAISEKVLGPEHPGVATPLNNLATLYEDLGRYGDAEPLYQRSLAIKERALGPDHPDVALALNNLAYLYRLQRRYSEAEPLFKRSLTIYEKTFGPDNLAITNPLQNIAGLYFEQSDWARALDFFQRATDVLVRRTERGTQDIGQALTGKRQGEAQQSGVLFSMVIKAANRLASESRNTNLPRETFTTAQWALASEAAQSLSQMAARGAKGDPTLATLVRERQDLVAEWQKRDQVRTAAVALASDKRDRQAEAANVTRLDAIDTRISTIDKRLAADFPDYAALASPAPLSVEDVQKELGADEALVLFLDTIELKPTEEETFIWVITKNDLRWVRSEYGTSELTRVVAALRCGLDYDGAWLAPDSACPDLLKVSHTRVDHARGNPLPFDLTRAHALYNALFSQVEDLIKDKHLFIVPSGPLTQLPFQVLVQSLPNDIPSGERVREVARLGILMTNLSEEDRTRLQWSGDGGVRIALVFPSSPAATAGLRPDDVLLAVSGEGFATNQEAIDKIRTHEPGSTVQLSLWREGQKREFAAVLDAAKLREWRPFYLDTMHSRSVHWLARDHALTVLPAVSSLKALRALAKESHAGDPYIGFGNPLLDGEPTRFKDDAVAAQRARDARCPASTPQQTASLSERGNRARGRVRNNGGVADVADIRSWAPLPETADELCDVAQSLGADPATHLYLGSNATETKVKALSDNGALARHKIVHFATHGAIAGEISSTSEPGLLMTPPKEASKTDDGYLSASDIAGLKLDADWVILSACNTAAGGAQGAEALSGLARAFFYAGARSLLVSHWEVSSDSTVKLITKAIAELKANPKIGRAEALRRSMLSLIATGKDYEAHPAFWAPFVLVGEGGTAR